MSGIKKFFAKDGTKSVISSLISILIGLVFGAIVVFIVGMSKKTIGVKGAWEGVRLIFFGVRRLRSTEPLPVSAFSAGIPSPSLTS